MFNNIRLGRRTVLKAIGLAVPAVTLSPLTSFANHLFGNPIVDENRKPGTTDWQISNPATNREIEGFASWTFIDPGQSINIFVNTAEPSYQLEVFRLGWYGGAGGRRIFGPVTLPGTQQVIPLPDPETGLIECRWTNPFRLQTRSDWTTGVYLVKLTSQSGKGRYVPFTLRNGPRFSQLLFQNSVTTYQAYNNWGGKSLYEYNSTDGIAAVKVSFNRPYADGRGAGELFQWELSMLRFLEREGYDVEYCTNMTTHRSSSLINNHRAFLSVGHDEYWSAEMRQNVTTIRDQGIHLGFFGANACYWQIRMEPSPLTGQPRRTMVCYKDRFQEDPLFGVDNNRVTTLWRDPLVNKPEEQLIGVQFDFYPVNTDLVVENAQHFIFQGTGLGNGDHLPGLLGYEADRTFGRGPANLIRLCYSPILSSARLRPAEIVHCSGGKQTVEQQQQLIVEENVTNNIVGFSEMTIYTAHSGALVFATGSMQFNWGLDDGTHPELTQFVNPAAQQMARNLFNRFDSNNDDD